MLYFFQQQGRFFENLGHLEDLVDSILENLNFIIARRTSKHEAMHGLTFITQRVSNHKSLLGIILCTSVLYLIMGCNLKRVVL